MNTNTDTAIVMQQSSVNRPHNNPPARKGESMTPLIYLRTFWMDYLLMAAMGALGLVLYSLRPAPSRVFPIYFSNSNNEIVYPEYAYAFGADIVPIWLAALLAFIVPFIFIMLMQIRVRSFNDVNTATMGLLFSLITAAVFQVFIKWLIGGFRPHFLAVCKPNLASSASVGSGNGFGGIMYDRSICTGDDKQINDALESMPSGHSTAAFAGLVYCSLYLNGKLKIFANYRPQYWKLVLFYAPLLGAVLIAASLTIDHYHHWYDITVGGIIGTLVAFGAYRFQYASVWDFRFNHVPLPRVNAEEGFMYYLDDEILPGSRKGGWADRRIYGAPFDATTMLMRFKRPSELPFDEMGP